MSDDEIKPLTTAEATVISRNESKAMNAKLLGWVRPRNSTRPDRILVYQTEDGQLHEVYARYQPKTMTHEVWIDGLHRAGSKDRLNALLQERSDLYDRIHQIDKAVASSRAVVVCSTQPLAPNEQFRVRWQESLTQAKAQRKEKNTARRAKKRKAQREIEEREEARVEIMNRTIKNRPKLTAASFDQVWGVAMKLLERRGLNMSKKNLIESMPKGLMSWEGKTKGSSGAWFWTTVTRAMDAVESGKAVDKDIW